MDRTEMHAFVDRWASAVAEGGEASLAHLVAPDVVDASGAAPVTGLASFVARTRALHAALADITIAAGDILVDGDQVAWRWTARGVHRETQRTVTIAGINVQRVVAGRVVEHWSLVDPAALATIRGS